MLLLFQCSLRPRLLGGTIRIISSMVIGQDCTTMAHQWANWFSATLCGIPCQGKQHPISFEIMVVATVSKVSNNFSHNEMWAYPVWEGHQVTSWSAEGLVLEQSLGVTLDGQGVPSIHWQTFLQEIYSMEIWQTQRQEAMYPWRLRLE